MIEAADLIEHFRSYWDQCGKLDNPEEARQQLLQKIVERVYVYEGHVLAVVLYGDFTVVLGEGEKAASQIGGVLKIKLAMDASSIHS